MPAKCKERERLQAAGILDVPALPVGAVRGTLCFRCLSPAEELLKCGACRRPGYCSKTCQKLDWTAVHKKQCKVLQRINQQESSEYKEKRTWDEYRECLHRYVREVRSTMNSRETEFIVQAQPYCLKCRRSTSQLAMKGVSLQACTKCRVVHTCKACAPKSSHSKSVCEAYQTQGKIERFRIELFEDTGKASAMTCTQTPRKTHSPLKDCNGWYDYYINISDKEQIKGNIHTDFSKLSISAQKADSMQQEFEERRRLFLLVATDVLTMPLTIVSALETLNLISTPSLKIHLVGATGREFLAMPSFEEIMHLLPAVQSLSLTTVGPSWMSGHEDDFVPKQDIECCPDCKSQSRQRTFASYRGLYHAYMSSAYFEKPDLLVAFNSGCADGDDAESDWTPSLTRILEEEIPALFTTYNEDEARHEMEKMGRLGAQFVVKPQKNRWASLVPEPEFLDKEGDMWWQNCWAYVVAGRTG